MERLVSLVCNWCGQEMKKKIDFTYEAPKKTDDPARELVAKAIRIEGENIESLVTEYMRETGLPPSEIVIKRQQEGLGVRIWVESARRQETQPTPTTETKLPAELGYGVREVAVIDKINEMIEYLRTREEE